MTGSKGGLPEDEKIKKIGKRGSDNIIAQAISDAKQVHQESTVYMAFGAWEGRVSGKLPYSCTRSTGS